MTKEELEAEELNHKTFEQSGARLAELKNDRHVDDIPLTDDYWEALKIHQKNWNK